MPVLPVVFILFWAGFATLILFVFGFGFLDMVVLEAGTLIVVVTFDVLDDDFLVEDSGADGLDLRPELGT